MRNCNAGKHPRNHGVQIQKLNPAQAQGLAQGHAVRRVESWPLDFWSRTHLHKEQNTTIYTVTHKNTFISTTPEQVGSMSRP